MISKTVKRSSKKTTMATNGGAERVEVGLGRLVWMSVDERGSMCEVRKRVLGVGDRSGGVRGWWGD